LFDAQEWIEQAQMQRLMGDNATAAAISDGLTEFLTLTSEMNRSPGVFLAAQGRAISIAVKRAGPG
jgi:hypothetical protein